MSQSSSDHTVERGRLYRKACSARNCTERNEYLASYSYSTGKGGRRSRATREYCQTHAEAFCERYDVEMP